MIPVWKHIPLFLVVFLAVDVWAIDKGHFTKLKPESAEKVLMSFEAPAYYLVTEQGGNNLGDTFNERPPFASVPFKHAILLFLDRNDAVTWAQRAQQRTNTRYTIKATNLNRMMVAQYKTLNNPISTDPKTPDFIVVETLSKIAPVVEAFVNTKTMEPFVYSEKGKKLIPAFFSRTDAIAFESKVKASGQGSFMRRGQDIRSHLALVERYISTDTPVITFGHDASRWMRLYVDEK